MAALALVAMGLAAPASGGIITLVEVNGTTQYIGAVVDEQVTTSEMNGMLVTAKVKSPGGVISNIQGAWNSGFDFAGNDFDLNVSGDTYDNGAWSFDFEYVSGQSYRLLSLIFDGLSGNTVFDRTFGTSPNWGTAGSSRGKDFGEDDFSDNTLITATYTNRVALAGNSPVGDLFANFQLDFSVRNWVDDDCSDWDWSWSNGWHCDGTFIPGHYEYAVGVSEFDNPKHFTQDTDIVSPAPTNGGQVPEPGSMMLLGSGLIGLAGAVRRRMKK